MDFGTRESPSIEKYCMYFRFFKPRDWDERFDSCRRRFIQNFLWFLFYSMAFSSLPIIASMVAKQVSPPTTLEMGSARKTPSVPSPKV